MELNERPQRFIDECNEYSSAWEQMKQAKNILKKSDGYKYNWVRITFGDFCRKLVEKYPCKYPGDATVCIAYAGPCAEKELTKNQFLEALGDRKQKFLLVVRNYCIGEVDEVVNFKMNWQTEIFNVTQTDEKPIADHLEPFYFCEECELCERTGLETEDVNIGLPYGRNIDYPYGRKTALVINNPEDMYVNFSLSSLCMSEEWWKQNNSLSLAVLRDVVFECLNEKMRRKEQNCEKNK